MISFGSQFLHPVLFYMRPGQNITTATRLHVVEDRWTDFGGRETAISFTNFMRHIEVAAWKHVAPPVFHETLDNLQDTCNPHTKEDGNNAEATHKRVVGRALQRVRLRAPSSTGAPAEKSSEQQPVENSQR
jgi:hypothetical protein